MNYLIMCIGNRYGGDDGIGPYIADQLKNEESDDFGVLDCGTVPENFTSVVKKHSPKNLIIIDAVEMNLIPGEIKIVPKEKIGVMHISTHGIPISVLMDYLKQYVKNIFFVGIQPKSMSGKMSEEIKKSGDSLVKIVKERTVEKVKLLN
ncbi:MAG: hydrogenase maturation peptidase HycI [Candidatus Thermoplasmatota archaeon]|nr:hydrogenase maturation peptidase HycI [Candidatus Thermoplasmatota archaeon]